MRKVQGLAVSKTLFVALSISLIVVGIAQAQLDIPVFTAKFTLTTQVQWDKTVLPPGDYTVTIESISAPTAALIRDASGRPVARFMSGIDGGKTSTRNALLIREKGGQLRLYALALASLGKVLVYDPALAQECEGDGRIAGPLGMRQDHHVGPNPESFEPPFAFGSVSGRVGACPAGGATLGGKGGCNLNRCRRLSARF